MLFYKTIICKLGGARCTKSVHRVTVGKSLLIHKTGQLYCTGPKYIITELVGSNKNVGVVRLNRPESRNAFNKAMFTELATCVAKYDADDKICAIILTGNEKIFSSGGDIKQVYKRTYAEMQKLGYLNEWENITKCRKPIIAAVNGFALGGAFELVVTCDIIYASETAKFSLSEAIIGTVCPGGGTQRLARSVSKTRVMELILSAKVIDAYTAENMGIISRVCPENSLLEECIKLAEKIGTHSPVAVQLAKEAVNQAFETNLKEGLELERHMVHAIEKFYATSYSA